MPPSDCDDPSWRAEWWARVSRSSSVIHQGGGPGTPLPDVAGRVPGKGVEELC